MNYAATVPGHRGAIGAFLGELVITFILMTVVLTVSNRPRLNRFTGLCAGALVGSYILVEAPLSGMSMNPARTVGSAVYAHVWTALWVYFTAPLLGILPDLKNVSDEEQLSAAARCIHQMRVLLRTLANGRPSSIYLITSSTAKEGKTSLTMSLGLSFAASGLRTGASKPRPGPSRPAMPSITPRAKAGSAPS